MEENKVSLTSKMTAYCRGYHAEHDNSTIFDDFLAYQLLTEEERTTFEHRIPSVIQFINPELAASSPDRAAALAWMVKNFLPLSLFVSRARYTEDRLEQALSQGIQQYVILGAGLDTFAFRRPELVEGLQVFEVDHPATQAYKRSRLEELRWEIPKHLHFIPVDLTQQTLENALKSSAYDPGKPTFFSWLGVVHYLPLDTVFAALRTIAGISPVGSIVVFDYYDTDAFIPGKASKRIQQGMEITRRNGEPVITGIDPSKLDGDLSAAGLHLEGQLSPSDIQERYFKGRSDGYCAYEHAHFACAVVK